MSIIYLKMLYFCHENGGQKRAFDGLWGGFLGVRGGTPRADCHTTENAQLEGVDSQFVSTFSRFSPRNPPKTEAFDFFGGIHEDD